jgi:superfamily II DNA or RNA helicase
LLAVTTTLEVGVDIGTLQGMLMANMPPQRFNYQQRVGRVGRRGQAFSFAVTLCRSKSHDAHYFQHPDQITGDPSPTPFLNTDQPEVLKRVLNKYFLKYFFKEFSEYLNNNPENDFQNWDEDFNVSDINGEFGKIIYTLPNPYLKDEVEIPNLKSYIAFILNLDDEFISFDKDVRAEEEQLLRADLNSIGPDYSCLVFDHQSASSAMLSSVGLDKDIVVQRIVFKTTHVRMLQAH